MELQTCKGQWALVTGASSGIGREFCVQLAAAGMNLVMVARRKDLLDAVARDLSQTHQIDTQIVPLDLAEVGAAAELKTALEGAGIKIRLLCNNAACGRWGHFESVPAESYDQMIVLNAATLVGLCHRFMADLTSFPTSAIINVSSPAALQPVPYMAVYAATKAFVYSFSQALYGEWKDRGVLVQTLVPGPTDTDFDAKAGAYPSALKTRESPAGVVTAALRHLGQDAPVVITARGTYKQRFFAGLFPAKTVIAQVGKMFKPPERH